MSIDIENSIFNKNLINNGKILLNHRKNIVNIPKSSIYAIEEMSELIKELTKDERSKGNKHNITQEVSDVFCTLMLYCLENDIDFNIININIDKKIKRAINRLEHGEF